MGYGGEKDYRHSTRERVGRHTGQDSSGQGELQSIGEGFILENSHNDVEWKGPGPGGGLGQAEDSRAEGL